MEFTRNNRQLLSKIATNDRHGENSPYFDGWKAYDSDPFHPTHNPHGVIQMGLAENQLCFDLIEKWILENPDASICTAEGIDKFKYIANFQDYHGLKEFREGVAKFMGRVGGNRVTFDPNRIVMSGGATGANETVMFCLADPGDAFLVPSPYYAGFARDLRWRTGLDIVPVDCKSSNNFRITRAALEEAYEKAQRSNINVKGVIVANPSNPLGTVLDKETMRSLVSFINDKNIHLVCDEIYAATVFSSPQFISIAEIIQDMDCNSDLIHIVYSLSKDMGFPGFRVGIVYSFNDDVMNCSRKMSSFGLVSSQTQFLLAAMLNDDEFVGNFLRESSKRLSKRHHVFTKGLERVGISSLESNAGLFFWMDMRPLLKEQTVEAEIELWRVIINKVKLNVSPGSSFQCSEPGWFRVCFANMDDETVGVALERIRQFVLQGKEKDDVSEKSKHWKKQNLRLSLSSVRLYDENLMSPHMISPHSPIPQSPLVRART
ncbi:1-aminocyclopropane-1-carboxylate synthase [Hibiscus syriacus]|uniref:1-aminocyclopropane-1-carboxylate synthase n=1 Tax=Hibiscus syriacus TaxID=106335 RepID=A0A6A3A6H4_HIBSY|nr:1-aminocyclopropane-1-carboxylate synthase-like [Hibiscus syriacus]KAE8699778.1 1-aminocyclopropane-1-carboxylate synthase [Hibiscus syriacus]